MKSLGKREIKIILTVVVIALSVILFLNKIYYLDYPPYVYSIFHNTDYKVYLKDNPFFKVNYIEKEKTYIRDLINFVNIDFSYNFNSSENSNVTYTYDITSELDVDYSNSNENIFSESEKIIDKKVLDNQDTNEKKIKESINIDYQKYLGKIESFKEEFNLPINAYLKIDFKVNTKINLTDEIDEVSSSEVTINLTEEVFNITVQESDEQKDTVIEASNFIDSQNIGWLILSGNVFLVAIVYLIYQISKYQIAESTKLKTRISRILNKYGEIIIEIKNEPSVKKATIVYVKDFDELLEIEEETREPILFFYKNEKEALFLIIRNNVMYKLSIKDEQ